MTLCGSPETPSGTVLLECIGALIFRYHGRGGPLGPQGPLQATPPLRLGLPGPPKPRYRCGIVLVSYLAKNGLINKDKVKAAKKSSYY